MINIITRIPQPAQATSFYRAIGPLQHLRSIMDIQFSEPSVYNWMTLGMGDLIFIQRPHSNQDVELVRLCKKLRLPVVVDYDDNLLDVPPWNPSCDLYRKDKSNIYAILSLADCVTVSTPALANILEPYRGAQPPCEVIPNAFPTHIVDFMHDACIPKQKIITWRGSNTHAKDLSLAYKGLEAALERWPGWRLVMFGDPPYEAIERFGGRLTVIPWQDPILYLDSLKAHSPAIHIVPLVDDAFNRSKSSIAYLEGIYAGAQVLGPDWPEWDRPDCWHYKDEASFTDRLFWLMDRAMSLNDDTAKTYVSDHLTLDQINPKRKALFESLVYE